MASKITEKQVCEGGKYGKEKKELCDKKVGDM